MAICKILPKFYNIRDRVLPFGSRRRALVKKLLSLRHPEKTSSVPNANPGISYQAPTYIKEIYSANIPKSQQLPESINELRTLHVGGYWRHENDTVRNMMLGLQSTGAQVMEFNTDDHPEALDKEGWRRDRGTFGPVWLRDQILMEHIERFSPHLIICNAGGLSFYPSVAALLRRRHYLLGIALSDPDVFGPTTKKIASNFDLFFTNDKSYVQKYRELGVNAELLPWGTNEKHFRPFPLLDTYKTDVLIIGRAHPNRIEYVKAIKERFDTRVYGEGWENYGISSLGTIYGDDFMHALSSAKIVPIFLNNPTGESMFVKPSIFDFPAAGVLVITNSFPDVEQYLTFGKEIIGFSSKEDLVSKIEYYIAHPQEAELIRTAGRARVLKEHTWTSVWPRIFSMCKHHRE